MGGGGGGWEGVGRMGGGGRGWGRWEEDEGVGGTGVGGCV
jgi:hypothetical protein